MADVRRAYANAVPVPLTMSDWPNSAAWLARDALPERLLELAAADSDAMAAVAPNFWVPREAIEADAREPRTLAEQVVFALYERVMKAELPPDWAGAEWWCQVYKPSRGLPFHFDKDEELMKATGEMRHPITSCVLYLNTAEECAVPPLGATLVMQQRFDAQAGCGVPEPSRHDVLVWPSRNCVLAFDGTLAHGVLDSASTRVRRSMLVNWWRSNPKGVQRATAEEYAVQHALATPLAEEALLAGAPTKAERVNIAVCELRAAEDCAAGPVPLEEALAGRGCGPANTTAIALHHPDCVIWQVETADGSEDEGSEVAFKPLVAALIPDSMACVESDNDESESSSSEGVAQA
jgi:hypothetical protein